MKKYNYTYAYRHPGDGFVQEEEQLAPNPQTLLSRLKARRLNVLGIYLGTTLVWCPYEGLLPCPRGISEINYTVTRDSVGEVDAQDYADYLETHLKESYPEAEINVSVSGIAPRPLSTNYEADPCLVDELVSDLARTWDIYCESLNNPEPLLSDSHKRTIVKSRAHRLEGNIQKAIKYEQGLEASIKRFITCPGQLAQLEEEIQDFEDSLI